MTAPLPLMTEDEVRRVTTIGGDEERGFGCLRTDRGALPLKEMTVDARVIGTFAHTTLRQVFVNTLGVPLEATYIFPLPDRAAVTRFSMEVAGRRIDGILEERMQARRTYDAAIAAGKRASIAEEERPGVFTLRVGNLMPGEAAVITLEMSGALPVADGEVTYRFPLVVAPRYMPGQLLGGENVGDGTAHDTDAVPDASRISPPVLLPGFQSPVRLGISVELDAAGLPLSQVRSSLHAAFADERNGRLQVRIPAGERLNRDFILRFRIGDDAVRTSARVVGDGPEATFALTVLPPVVNIAARPKDVVFVLDRSGSMGGWKMVAARRATARMIDALRGSDRFQVLAFDDHVEELPLGAQSGNGLIEATDRNRFRSSEWLAKVDARGGTEMAAPLARAADLLGGGYLERDRVLVFVTDGQVGNEAQLIKLLGQRLKGARVFALGIDQAVNAGFLNRLANLGRSGEAELVESEDRLDEVLVRLHRRVDAPVIAELSVDVEGGHMVYGTLAPSQLPDVFAGVPATITGRVSGGASSFLVRGRMSDGSRFEQRVPAVEVQNPAVRTAWARLHLRDLEDRFDAGQGDKRELERRIVDVSLRHSVLCRFTAFVAVDHEVVNRGGRNHPVTQAVESPAGWEGAASTKSGGIPMKADRQSVARAAPAPQAPMASVSFEAVDSLGGDFEEADDDVSGAMPMAPAGAPPPPPARSAERMRAPNTNLTPQPAMKKKGGGGFLGAMKDAVSDALGGGARKEEAKARAQAPATIASFHARIAELVEVARRRTDLVRALSELMQRLQLLLEDMAHAGVPGDERRALDEVSRTLAEALLSGDEAEYARALDLAEDVLDRAAGGVPKAAGRREGFWR